MNSRPLILSSLLAAVVGGTAVQGWRMSHPALAEIQPAAPVVSKSKPKVATAPKAVGERQFSKSRPSESGGSATSTSIDVLPHPAAHPARLVSGVAAISERELQRLAAQVEQEANHDLKHLVKLLDLTEAQQDKIFDSIVRHTPGWNPAMQTFSGAAPIYAATGTPAPSANAPGSASTGADAFASASDPAPAPASASDNRNDLLNAIAPELTPDQQVELANAELERQEWWEEIITKLLPDQDTPSITGETGPAVAATLPPAGDRTEEQPEMLAE